MYQVMLAGFLNIFDTFPDPDGQGSYVFNP